MKTVPMKKGRWRVFLDTPEYRTLLECAYESTRKARSTRQVRLEMRLMACSMRVDTVSELEFGQFEKRETPEGDRWMCVVEGKDSTDREAETRPRAVFIPNDIMDQVKAYADRKNLDEDGLLFQHSTRTVQRDVKRSAANAAVKTGDEDFRKVSSHDLRRYFASHLLFRHQVPPPVVRQLGGWKSDEAMYEYLVLPDDVLFKRLDEAGLLGTSYDKMNRNDHEEKISATTDRLEEQVAAADSDDALEAAGRKVQRVFSDIEGITVDVGSDTDTASAGASEEVHNQLSFGQFDTDEDGMVDPFSAVKVAYLATLTMGSWAVTLAPTLG